MAWSKTINMKTDRLKELEKIAEKLSIGQNREVECVSCHKNIQFKDAILLINKEIVSHLCFECNDKLTRGELTKQQIAQDEILKHIEKMRDLGKQNVPFIPGPEEYPWKISPQPWVMPYSPTYIYYTVCTSSSIGQGIGEANMLLKLEPNYANRSN